jgi:hypothetical protein
MTTVEQGNEGRAREILGFLDRLLDRRDLDPEILNAIAISFIEPDSLRESVLGGRLWEDMPERIRALLIREA